MSRKTALRCPARRQATPEQQRWAVAALRRRAGELGRPPVKSDFPPEQAQRIKAALGPWPRALEAAGLKEVPERIVNRKHEKGSSPGPGGAADSGGLPPDHGLSDR
ncbi:MAG: hypothetical protein PUK81_06885 [Firmicutes bacterium]|nr:hypothetical protein [Clostridiales bacterium]MDD7652249.1 hypothetical protein [Bacillota bacterium]